MKISENIVLSMVLYIIHTCWQYCRIR